MPSSNGEESNGLKHDSEELFTRGHCMKKIKGWEIIVLNLESHFCISRFGSSSPR